MKNISVKWLILLLVMSWYSCERVEIPDSEVKGMPFGIKGQIDGKDLDLGTYQSGVKMQTSAEWVEDSVWQFSGTLHAGNQDGSMLQIQIRNRREGRDSVIVDWQEFRNDSLVFQQEGGRKDSLHRLKITVENSENLPVNFIQCGDQKKTDNSHVKEFLLPKRDKVSVIVGYGTDQRTGLFSTEILPGPQTSSSFPNWIVGTTTDESARLIASLSNPAGANIFSYNWGNGFTSFEALTANHSGMYQVFIKDQYGSLHMHKKYLLYNNSERFFTYGNSFVFKSEWMPGVIQVDKKQLRSVRISYRDRNNELFLSDLGEYAINRFAIEDIKSFERDARGRPTLAIKVRFTARLTSRNGQVITLENCSGWFAIGLP